MILFFSLLLQHGHPVTSSFTLWGLRNRGQQTFPAEDQRVTFHTLPGTWCLLQLLSFAVVAGKTMCKWTMCLYSNKVLFKKIVCQSQYLWEIRHLLMYFWIFSLVSRFSWVVPDDAVRVGSVLEPELPECQPVLIPASSHFLFQDTILFCWGREWGHSPFGEGFNGPPSDHLIRGHSISLKFKVGFHPPSSSFWSTGF